LNFLAIDQSTSATKALLFDDHGSLLDQESRAHQQHYPQPGWVEHDAEEIYRNVLAVCAELLARHPGASPAALSLTNQRETVVIFERRTGRPLRPAIVWQCRRGTRICQDLQRAGHEQEVRQRTGLTIDTYFSASKLTWLAQNEPQTAGMLKSGEALAGTIDAYLIYRLTNGSTFACDPTNACRTLLYNIRTLSWDAWLCNLFGVPIDALPEVRSSSAVFGETDLSGALSQPIPICGVMGDSQAALFAQRCFMPGSAKVTFGTGSSLLLNAGTELRLPPGGIVSTLAWAMEQQPVYAYEGLINFSAAVIAWLKDQLGLIASPQESEVLARSVPDNGGVYLVPAFVGLGAPYWKPEARAAILGLTPHSTRAHIARAALESIAYQVKDALDVMAEAAGAPLAVIHADGGAVRNRFLMQLVADLTRCSVHVPEVSELSALGAVYACLLGLGRAGSLQDLEALPRTIYEYHPILPADQAARLHQGWLEAVRRIL
jgi:glycerol kinase